MGEEIEFIRGTTVTGVKYDLFKCIKILNPQQSAFYVEYGVPLKDIKLSKDKNGKAIFVYYFYKEDTKDAYDVWCKQRGQKKNEEN